MSPEDFPRFIRDSSGRVFKIDSVSGTLRAWSLDEASHKFLKFDDRLVADILWDGREISNPLTA